VSHNFCWSRPRSAAGPSQSRSLAPLPTLESFLPGGYTEITLILAPLAEN